MKQLNLSYRILNEINQIDENTYNDNLCMIRYIMISCSNVIKGFTGNLLRNQ